jgi:hypothetical protein
MCYADLVESTDLPRLVPLHHRFRPLTDVSRPSSSLCLILCWIHRADGAAKVYWGSRLPSADSRRESKALEPTLPTGKLLEKGLSIALGKIPAAAPGTVLQAAFDAACDTLIAATASNGSRR